MLFVTVSVCVLNCGFCDKDLVRIYREILDISQGGNNWVAKLILLTLWRWAFR